MREIVIVHRRSCKDWEEIPEDFLAWKTCLRQILFLTETDFFSFQSQLMDEDEFYKTEEASSFLIEVLCGLHSPIVGETEVFGQFRSFHQANIDSQLIQENQKWFQHIFSCVKTIRRHHLTNLGSHSYSSWVRHNTKNDTDITFIGFGQLSREIYPWIQPQVKQILVRTPSKIELKDELAIHKLEDVFPTSTLIVAAPISTIQLLPVIQSMGCRLHKIIDMRNCCEPLAFSGVEIITLQDIFKSVSESKETHQHLIDHCRARITEMSKAYYATALHRPYGWEDACV